MIIQPHIVRESIERFRRAKFDPEKLGREIGESDRSKHASRIQRDARYKTLLAEAGDPRVAHAALERLIGGNDLVGVNYLERGTTAGRSVCRVHLRDGGGDTVGYGTGFLVAPGVLMTNHHVISASADARNAIAEFDYELDEAGNDKRIASFAIDPQGMITDEGLDVSLVAVQPRTSDGRALDDYGWLVLDGTPGKTIIGEYLTIIQHPGGERKQICVRENKLLKYDPEGKTIWYQTDTVAGSSGSPVFNASWQVVALHHSGVPKTRNNHVLTVDGQNWDPKSSTDESGVQWIANEGMRISAIVAFLRANHAGAPLARAVLGAAEGPRPRRRGPDGGEGMHTETSDGELRVTIPVRVAVRIGDLVGQGARVAVAAPAVSPPTRDTGPAGNGAAAAPVGIENVVIKPDYPKRTGYQPDFLGGGGLRIPLPSIQKAKINIVPVNGDKSGVLKYWDYSVVMHGARRLAFYSAVNVDATKRPPNAGRDGDKWYEDPRIDGKYQIDDSFYKKQSKLEADRSMNPFDKGHLTRRLDAQWGSTSAVSKRNGDDSFHFTNCSPQHHLFNQGSKRWLGLEDYVIKGFAGNGRASVFNGPVFDAPLSTLGPGGRVVPTIGGAAHKDPTFKTVAVPKLFYKIVACRKPNGKLAAAAFLMSQEDLLASTKRIKGMPALKKKTEALTEGEARLYQVKVREVERLTGLHFGPLVAADAHEIADFGPRPIEALEDIHLG